MDRALRIVLAAALAVAASSSPSLSQRRPAEPGTGAIDGRIRLPSGFAGGRGLKVTLKNTFSPISTIYADRNGEFHFDGLRSGNYSVIVEDPNERFDGVDQSVAILPGDHIVLDVYLRERDLKNGPKQSAGVTSVSELDAKVPAEARKEYDKSVKYAKKGETDKAIASLERALAIYPNFPKAHNDLGVQYLRSGRATEAVEHFETAARLDPQAFNPQLNIGVVLVDRGEYTRAIDELRHAISIDSSQPAAHLSLGIAFYETQRLDDAFEELQKTLLLGKDEYAVANYYEGLILVTRGQNAEAVERLDAFLLRVPSGPMAQRARDLTARLKNSN